MHNNESQKGFALPLVISIIVILAIGGGLYFYNTRCAGLSDIARALCEANNKGEILGVDGFRPDLIKKASSSAPVVGGDKDIIIDWKTYTNDQLMDRVLVRNWRNEAMYFLALENNFLIIDQGTAPDPRGLTVYDLNNNMKVYDGLYSKPILIKDNTITYWKPVEMKVTNENCPQSAEWLKQGLGAEIESHVVLSLIDFKNKELGESRCSATQ